MNEVIYYPTFEVSDQQWLKFAMLYLEKLNPIIPPAGDAYLTDEFKRISGETDLIDIHRPDEKEGRSATRDAIEQVEKVLNHPERYADIFKPNFIKDWKAPEAKRQNSLNRSMWTNGNNSVLRKDWQSHQVLVWCFTKMLQIFIWRFLHM